MPVFRAVDDHLVGIRKHRAYTRWRGPASGPGAGNRATRSPALPAIVGPIAPMPDAAKPGLLPRERESGERAELDVYRRRRIDQGAESQPASDRLDTEHGNVVGVLVGGIEECSRRIDVYPARPLPAGRLPTDHFEVAGFRLDLEHRDAVMTTVRGVEETP